MRDAIRLIAENLDDLDFDLPQSAPEFTKPHQHNRPIRRRPSYTGSVFIEISLLDKNGEESPDGDLYSLTDDTELPDTFDFLIPMLQASSDYYGELDITFSANSARDDAGGVYDDRDISSAVLNLYEDNKLVEQIPIPDMHLQDVFSQFEQRIYAAAIRTQ